MKTLVSMGAALAVAGALAAQTPPDRKELTELSRSFLRDSAELPMDVAVTTLVKDQAGKTKRDSKSTVRFLFRGYNKESGRWSFRANSGFFSMRILHDSVAGNFALLDAFTHLAPKPDAETPIQIENGAPGESFLVKASDANCHQFHMMGDFPYPDKRCQSSMFLVRRTTAGGLAIQRFTVDVAELPATGKVPYLGDVKVLKIHSEGEVQEARMPDDPRPFLIPKRVVTAIETDKGTMTVTNAYTLRLEPARKP